MFCIAILYSGNEGQRSYAKLNFQTQVKSAVHPFSLHFERAPGSVWFVFSRLFQWASMEPTKHKLPVRYLEGYALYAPFNVY